MLPQSHLLPLQLLYTVPTAVFVLLLHLLRLLLRRVLLPSFGGCVVVVVVVFEWWWSWEQKGSTEHFPIWFSPRLRCHYDVTARPATISQNRQDFFAAHELWRMNISAKHDDLVVFWDNPWVERENRFMCIISISSNPKFMWLVSIHGHQCVCVCY